MKRVSILFFLLICFLVCVCGGRGGFGLFCCNFSFKICLNSKKGKNDFNFVYSIYHLQKKHIFIIYANQASCIIWSGLWSLESILNYSFKNRMYINKLCLSFATVFISLFFKVQHKVFVFPYFLMWQKKMSCITILR